MARPRRLTSPHSLLTPRLHGLESSHVTQPDDTPRQILDAQGMALCMDQMAAAIATRWQGQERIAFVGVHRRGIPFARQLASRLAAIGKEIDFGKIDITQYRDDLKKLKMVPMLEGSDLPFDLNDAVVILCDEVIYTARTTRAALDELLDFGRPRCVQFAALVDRGGRELPIQPDYFGIHVDVPANERVNVRFVDGDGRDEVFVSRREDSNA